MALKNQYLFLKQIKNLFNLKNKSKFSFINRQIDLLIQRIRNRLASRGPKGFIGMARQFKLIDLDSDQKLSISEFKKAIRDYRIEVTDYEIEILFNAFDQDSNGSIDFEEFIRFIQVLSFFFYNIINFVFSPLI